MINVLGENVNELSMEELKEYEKKNRLSFSEWCLV